MQVSMPLRQTWIPRIDLDHSVGIGEVSVGEDRSKLRLQCPEWDLGWIDRTHVYPPTASQSVELPVESGQRGIERQAFTLGAGSDFEQADSTIITVNDLVVGELRAADIEPAKPATGHDCFDDLARCFLLGPGHTTRVCPNRVVVYGEILDNNARRRTTIVEQPQTAPIRRIRAVPRAYADSRAEGCSGHGVSEFAAVLGCADGC